MEFIIGGHTIDIASLEPSIDDQFVSLHAAYFGQGVLKWALFEKAANAFFDKYPDPNSGHHDMYFGNFTVIWRSYLNSHKFDAAEKIWDKAMSAALSWESLNPGKRVHKGTPYYFWGVTALKRGNLDRGYALMHQAVAEDSLTYGVPYPDSPAFAFVSLNYSKPAQYFRDWLYKQMLYIGDRQKAYSATYSRPFSLDNFKDKFLLKPPSVDIVSLFSYSLAQLMQLSKIPARALASGFAAQLESNLLFVLTLVIDGIIKAKNPTKWKFVHHAEFLLQIVREPLTEQELGEINQAFREKFDETVGAMLDGTFGLKDGKILSQAQREVSLAYGMRNRGAHDVTAAPTVWKRFTEIEPALFNVLYMAVDRLP